MGSAQSYLSPELVGTALTGLVVAGAFGIVFTRTSSSGHVHDSEVAQGISGDSGIKKEKKKPNQGPLEDFSPGISPSQPPAPRVTGNIPGQFDVNSSIAHDSLAAENAIPKAKKPKKKKNKNEDAVKTVAIPQEHHSESFVQLAPKSRDIKRSPQPLIAEVPPSPEISSSRPLDISTLSLDTDSSWTRVGSKRSRKSSGLQPSGESQSEAGFTTSQRDESSPVRNTADDDPHDSFLLQQAMLPSSSRNSENRKTLAEKLLPKPQKTGVDDLLETPDYSLSRVIRVTPVPMEEPVAGFSWADYEDVPVTTDGGENDADGEDDGWGVVTSKRPKRLNISSSTTLHSSQPLKASETLTKKQRQNAQKRERQKGEKADAEAQRLATLAGHKRKLEKARIEELFGKVGGGSKPSSEMKAIVDDRGKLIWE